MKIVGYNLLESLRSIAAGDVREQDISYILSDKRYADETEMLFAISTQLPEAADGSDILVAAITLWRTGRIFMPCVEAAHVRTLQPAWRDAMPTEMLMDIKDGRPIPFSSAAATGRTIPNVHAENAQ